MHGAKRSLVNVAPVPDLHNANSQYIMVYRVDHSVIAHAQTIIAASSLQRFYITAIRQPIDRAEQAFFLHLRLFGNKLDRPFVKLNLVLHSDLPRT